MSTLALPELAVPASATPARRLACWMLLCVGLLGFLVYFSSLASTYAYDDVAIAHDNVHVQELDWTGIWTDNYWPKKEGVIPDALYRPITLWSFLANQATTPDFPWAFHLTNVILHAIVAMLVSLLAWRFTASRAVALLAGALFAVHPLHTEAVASLVGRAEILAALWSFLAILVYLPDRPILEETGPTRRGYWHGIVVAACFFIAVLCKETPAMIPPAIVGLDLWRWMRWPKQTRPAFFKFFASQSWRYYLPLFIASVIYLALRIPACGLMGNIRIIHHIVNPLNAASVFQRIVTPFMLLDKYLALIFWPVHLSADYSSPSLMPTANIFHPLPLVGLLACLLAILASVRFWRRTPQIALIAGLFLSSYILVANIIRIGTIFGERLFYWPSAFVLILIAWGMVWLCQWLAARRAQVAIAAGAALLLVAFIAMSRLTWVRNTDWADNITLAIATCRDNPQISKACAFAGTQLLLSDRSDLRTLGVSLLKRSAELAPDFPTPFWELAKYYGRTHDFVDSVIYFCKTARLDPGSRMSHDAAQAIFTDMKTRKPETYMPDLEAYQKAHPEDEAIYFALTLAYHAQGKFDLAESTARRALDLGGASQQDTFIAYHEVGAELASIRLDKGDIDSALSEYRAYVHNMSGSAEAHCTFAAALLTLDTAKYPFAPTEAGINIEIAKKIDPTNPAINNLTAKLKHLHDDPAALASQHENPGSTAQVTDANPAHDPPLPPPGGKSP